MIRRLRRKFVLVNMAIVTLMLAVIFALVLIFTGNSLREESMMTIHAVADQRPDKPGGPMEQHPYFTVEFTPEGELRVTGSAYYDLSDQAFLEDVLSQATGKTGLIREYSLRYGWAHPPWGEQLVFVDATAELAAIGALVRNCALIAAVSVALFFFISLFLARWAIRPVEKAWQEQRQFVADASHELKTPLAVITTNAELLRGAYPPEEKERFLQSIQTVTRQMRGLVENLLELARADNGTARLEFAPLQLETLIEEGLLPFEPVLFEKGMTLESRLQSGLRVRGSRSHLLQVLEILLDNAGKYAAPGSPVVVELTGHCRSCLLRVSNMGPPIPREALPKLFTRFYRADPARSRDGSYGLGLSIAQSIVNAHGGRIWADSRDGWNVFSVLLPLI